MEESQEMRAPQQGEASLSPLLPESGGDGEDTRCLTCWLVLDGSIQYGYLLHCGHWLCWPCLFLLQDNAGEEVYGPNTCFRCHAPVQIPAKMPPSPPALRKIRPSLSRLPIQTGSLEEMAPILRSPERGVGQKKAGAFWKKLGLQSKDFVGGAGFKVRRSSYSKLEERDSPRALSQRTGEGAQTADNLRTRNRLRLRLF